MECPHCGQEHPDNFQFCPVTGQELSPQFKACINEQCPDYGKYILPLDSKYCPTCGNRISSSNAKQSNKSITDVDVIHIVRKNLKNFFKTFN